MAATVYFEAMPGLTLTVKIFAGLDSDTVVDTFASITQETNRTGLYKFQPTGYTGLHRVRAYDASGNIHFSGFVDNLDSASVFEAKQLAGFIPEVVPGGDGGLALAGADADTLETLSDQLDVIDSVVDAILLDTAEIGAAGAGLTDLGGMSTAMKAEVNAEVDTALSDVGATSTRYGYIDNLNVGGNVASSVEVTAIQNNTRVTKSVPAVLELPSSGSVDYRVEIYLYDESGNMEAPDSAPTVALVNAVGTDRSSRLDSTTMTLVSTGRYRVVYTSTAGDAKEQLNWSFSVTEGGATRVYGGNTILVDTIATDFTSADRAKLDALHDTKVPDVISLANINAEVDTAISDAALATAAALSTVAGNVTSVLADTAELQADWADGGRLDLILDARSSQSSVDTIDGIVDAILLDTAELQGDLTDGGRLDLIFDAILADTAELQTDDYPTRFDTLDTAIGNLAVGSSAISTTATSFTKAGAEAETNTYTSTAALDGTVHLVEDDGGSTDVYYEFDVGPNGVPVSVDWEGYARLNGDSYAVYFYNWVSTAWEQVGTITATNSTTVGSPVPFSATVAHVGSGANNGKVRWRVQSSTGTEFATDRLLCNYTIVNAALGYDMAAVWVDEASGTSTGTTPGVDGLVTNRSDDFDNAQTIADSLGYHDLRITNGNAITLAAALEGYDVYGNQCTLALGSQNVGGSEFYDFNTISGTGSSTGERIRFDNCTFGTCTLHPFQAEGCEFSGTITAGAAGDYRIFRSKSDVAGSGSPAFVLSGTGGATTVQCREWYGGSTWTLDSDVSAFSLECTKGGSQTITTGGATSVEVRGFCKSVTVTTSAGSTTNILAFTGPITINGTGGTVNIYGQHSGVTDNSTGTTVNDYSVDGPAVGTSVAAILADTAELQADWADGGRLDLILDARSSQSSVDTIDGIVDAILLDTAEIGAAGAGLSAIPDMATATNQTTIAGYIDTEIATIITNLATVDTVVDAIKVVTDQFVFTVANQVDANALTGGGGLDASGVRSAIGLASANLDTQLAALPTATENADATLTRAVSNVEDSADRHSIAALVMIGTNSSVTGTTLTAKKPSDDSTFANYTVIVTTGADPITGVS